MALKSINVKDFRWQIIINPNACDKKCMNNWAEAEAQLAADGIQYDCHQANGSHKGVEIAQMLCKQGHRHLMVVGGDGSINEVVNGIFLSGVNTREVFLAVIPHGRGNDWARTHHFPQTMSECINGFLTGSFTQHDIGLTSVYQDEKMVEQRYFININSYCFAAEVIYQTVYNKPKLDVGNVYFRSVFKVLFSHKSTPVKIIVDGESYESEPFMFVVANCQYNGGGMRQAPEARYDDGLFDVVVVPKIRILTILLKIRYIFSGKHIEKIKGVKQFRGQKVTVESQPAVLAEMEGELLKLGRYEVEMQPSALNLLTFNK